MRPLIHLLLAHLVGTLQILQGEQDVLLHRHVGIQGIVLEHQADAPVLGGQLGDIVLTEEDLARGGLLQAGDHVQRGGLAAAGGAQKADQLAVGDLEGEIIDGNDFLTRLLVPAGEDFCQILQDNFHTKFPSYIVSCFFICAGWGLASTVGRGRIPLGAGPHPA